MLLCLAALLFGTQSITGGGGPGGARAKNNAALITSLAATADQPWDWNELESRLKANRLSAVEVDQAIGQLIIHLNTQRAAGKGDRPLLWSEKFIDLAITRGDVSAGQLQKLCKAFYGATPKLRGMHSTVRQGQPIQFDMQLAHPWEIRSMKGIYAIRRILINGKPVSVLHRYKKQPMQPDELSGSYHDGLNSPVLKNDLAPGEYEITFEVDMGVLPASAALVGIGGKPGQKARWQSPLCTWRTKLSSKIRITDINVSPIKLLTDPAFDPGGPNGLNVLRAYTVPLEKGVRIMLLIKSKLPPAGPYLFRTKVQIGESEPVSGKFFGAAKNWGLNGGEQRIDLPTSLPAEVNSITVILEPDPKYAERYPRLESIWGKRIIFQNVPLERNDLGNKPSSQ